MSRGSVDYDSEGRNKTAESILKGSAVCHSRKTKKIKKKKSNFRYNLHFRVVNMFIVAVILFTTSVMADLRLGGVFEGLTTDLQAEAIKQSRIDTLRKPESRLAVEVDLDSNIPDVEETVSVEEVIPVVVEDEVTPAEPKVLTAVVYGHDEHGGGVDTTILVFANLDIMDVHLLSLPRDMELNFSKEARAEIVHAGYRPHTNSYGKLTNWGRSFNSEITQIVTRELSRVFEIPIDFYFGVDVKAFVKIVDLVGPIPFDVKQRMYYHNGERLLVDLQPGLQNLTGSQAEGLVRFRNYKMGDFDRTDIQRQFIAAIVNHVRDQGLGASDVFGLAQIALTHMDTNFINPFPYFNLFGRLNDVTIHSYILPLELKGNSWRLSDKSFELLDDILKQVYEVTSVESKEIKDNYAE